MQAGLKRLCGKTAGFAAEDDNEASAAAGFD